MWLRETSFAVVGSLTWQLSEAINSNHKPSFWKLMRKTTEAMTWFECIFYWMTSQIILTEVVWKMLHCATVKNCVAVAHLLCVELTFYGTILTTFNTDVLRKPLRDMPFVNDIWQNMMRQNVSLKIIGNNKTTWSFVKAKTMRQMCASARLDPYSHVNKKSMWWIWFFPFKPV